MAALLLGRELILVVDAGRSGFDHRAHELVRLQRAAEASFRVGDDRQQPVDFASFDGFDLAGTEQRVVQAPDERGRAVRWVEALIGIGLPGQVRVGGDLPAREVNRLQAGLRHLHGLAARQRSEGGDVLIVSEERPEALGTAPRERLLDVDRAAKADDVSARVWPLDALPARAGAPFAVEGTIRRAAVGRLGHGRLLVGVVVALAEVRARTRRELSGAERGGLALVRLSLPQT